ncbi:hypothetical protein Gogos_001127 [Gossypium gossypioides]|uniref:DUF4283 domain-containing protein n=1 Tax=Gossypium gossypioides TaxID=34282 RepID=A0A7J9CUS3_GOSGO|nr:hypothetical protein [Gossypium gossypioides]
MLMEEELANLNLINKEEEAPVVENENKLRMVQRCLTNNMVHFPSLRNTIADLWHPIGGYSYQILVRKDSTGGRFDVSSVTIGRILDPVHENQSEVGMSLPLKRKKKLSYGESFCPIRVRIDSSKVIFEWDISLCAVTRRRTASVSRWFGEVDGPVCQNLDKESGDNGHNGRDDRDIRWIWKDDLERLYPNLNYIP